VTSIARITGRRSRRNIDSGVFAAAGSRDKFTKSDLDQIHRITVKLATRQSCTAAFKIFIIEGSADLLRPRTVFTEVLSTRSEDSTLLILTGGTTRCSANLWLQRAQAQPEGCVRHIEEARRGKRPGTGELPGDAEHEPHVDVEGDDGAVARARKASRDGDTIDGRDGSEGPAKIERVAAQAHVGEVADLEGADLAADQRDAANAPLAISDPKPRPGLTGNAAARPACPSPPRPYSNPATTDSRVAVAPRCDEFDRFPSRSTSGAGQAT
jgi:hypothetical protein